MSGINLWLALGVSLGVLAGGCTVKAVGDPERPITINANIKIDIKGLENTATNIEDYVSGDRAAVSSKM
ncbi:MAG: hypothetical protein KC897_03910 [Candidatus Omnitrophica bacterium]|nr:hypothetical protein [Candidatus Omnitrophota bacterium]MCB9720857.1 hypothetical protein [Candidatus Omnitrophota bacterium]